MNRTKRPQTAEEIRNEIEKAETRIRLENLTIEALKTRLDAIVATSVEMSAKQLKKGKIIKNYISKQ